MATVFEKVISGEFDGSFVYKDDVCVAFMDLNPLNSGHVLVVPREPVELLTSLNPETAAHLFAVGQKILKALQSSGVKYEGANVFLSNGEVAGQEVPHVHLHILPRFSGDGLKMFSGRTVRSVSRDELNTVAAMIVKALN